VHGNELLGCCPLERATDPADALIDQLATPSGFDPFLADGLDRERAEVPGRGVPVESANDLERLPELGSSFVDEPSARR